MLAALLPRWLEHPLSSPGASFWGGIGGDLAYLSMAGAVLAAFWRHHNCHREKCWRMSWHPGPDGHPVCRVHHPDHSATSGVLARILGRLRKF